MRKKRQSCDNGRAILFSETAKTLAKQNLENRKNPAMYTDRY